MILVIRFIDVSIAQKERIFNPKMKIVHICVKIHFASRHRPHVAGIVLCNFFGTGHGSNAKGLLYETFRLRTTAPFIEHIGFLLRCRILEEAHCRYSANYRKYSA